MLMKILITLGIIALVAQAEIAHGSTIKPLSNDRLLFMCGVETIECPHIEPPKGVPLQVKLKPEPAVTATSTTAQAEQIAQLKLIIIQLNDLLIRLRALQYDEAR